MFFFKLSDKLFLFVPRSFSDTLDDEDDNVIHMGHAIMTFYSALIDLLGRCAPELHVSDHHYRNNAVNVEKEILQLNMSMCIADRGR